MSQLKAMIREGEHVRQDFKFRIDDTKKIARTLAAFANTQGGRLLIGVKDNGKIAGVDPTEELHMIEAAAQINCNPPLNFETKVWQEDMRLVLQIDIAESPIKPVKAKDDDGAWKIYIRKDDNTIMAGKMLALVWKYKTKLNAKPEKFAEDEQRFLFQIKEHQPVTLSKLYRISNLSKQKIEHLLALFVCWEIVEMNIDETGTYYSVF